MGLRWVLVLGVVSACGETQRAGNGDTGVPETTDGQETDGQGTTDGQGGGSTTAASSTEATTGTEGPGGTGGSGGQPSTDCSLVRSDPAEIILDEQADVEALRNVATIAGALSITGTVSDLSPLECLREVTGDLSVFETEALNDLSGLGQLTTLGGSLYVGYRCDKGEGRCIGNVALSDMDALGNLTRATDIRIEAKCFGEGLTEACAKNTVLTSISFDELREVETLSLSDNPALIEAHFAALLEASAIYVRAQPALELLRFPSLTSLETLDVRSAPLLRGLGFAQLSEVGLLGLHGTGVVDFRDFEALSEIDSLYLAGNRELTSLEGLGTPEKVRRIVIDSNSGLTNLSGLTGLVDAEETLQVMNNSNLVSLDGLESLEHAGQLWINGNAALGDIQALGSLEVVDASLTIWSSGLTSVSGLGQLVQVGSLNLQANELLENLRGFESLSQVDEYLTIYANPKLPTCEAEWLRDQIGAENAGSVSIGGNDDSGVCE